jgi:hypothetical protein
VLEINKNYFGEEHFLFASTLSNSLEYLRCLGEYEAAKKGY